VINKDTVVGQDGSTCNDLQQAGLNGELSSDECRLSDELLETCKCWSDPTKYPPSQTPSLHPATGVPTWVPTWYPSDYPSLYPTFSPIAHTMPPVLIDNNDVETFSFEKFYMEFFHIDYIWEKYAFTAWEDLTTQTIQREANKNNEISHVEVTFSSVLTPDRDRWADYVSNWAILFRVTVKVLRFDAISNANYDVRTLVRNAFDLAADRNSYIVALRSNGYATFEHTSEIEVKTLPTESPTQYPSDYPSYDPTGYPTRESTGIPTFNPTHYPTQYPTQGPTQYPSDYPTGYPTFNPTGTPSHNPSHSPISYFTKKVPKNNKGVGKKVHKRKERNN